MNVSGAGAGAGSSKKGSTKQIVQVQTAAGNMGSVTFNKKTNSGSTNKSGTIHYGNSGGSVNKSGTIHYGTSSNVGYSQTSTASANDFTFPSTSAIKDITLDLRDIVSNLDSKKNSSKKQTVNITTASGNMGSISYNVDEERKKARAAGATVTLGFVEGVCSFGESLSDTGKIIAMTKATPITVAIDALQFINSFTSGKKVTSVTENMWNAGRKDVEQEKVKDSFDSFYQNTEIGKAISNDLPSYDVLRSLSAGIGYNGSIIATGGLLGALTGISSVGGGILGFASENAGTMATMAGVSGFGKNTQDAWNNGAETAEGIFAGVAGGLKDLVQFYLGGKIAGLNPTSNSALNRAIRIGFDGLDYAAEGFIDPAINLIYSKDSNYIKEFENLGGWDNVLNKFLVGSAASTVGEGADWLGGFFKGNNSGLSNANTIVQSEKNIVRDASHGTRKSYIDSRVPKIEEMDFGDLQSKIPSTKGQKVSGVSDIKSTSGGLKKSLDDTKVMPSLKEADNYRASLDNYSVKQPELYNLPDPDGSPFVQGHNSMKKINDIIKSDGSGFDKVRNTIENLFNNGSESTTQTSQRIISSSSDVGSVKTNQQIDTSSLKKSQQIDNRVPKVEEVEVMNLYDDIPSNNVNSIKNLDDTMKWSPEEIRARQAEADARIKQRELARKTEAAIKEQEAKIEVYKKIIENPKLRYNSNKVDKDIIIADAKNKILTAEAKIEKIRKNGVSDIQTTQKRSLNDVPKIDETPNVRVNRESLKKIEEMDFDDSFATLNNSSSDVRLRQQEANPRLTSSGRTLEINRRISSVDSINESGRTSLLDLERQVGSVKTVDLNSSELSTAKLDKTSSSLKSAQAKRISNVERKVEIDERTGKLKRGHGFLTSEEEKAYIIDYFSDDEAIQRSRFEKNLEHKLKGEIASELEKSMMSYGSTYWETVEGASSKLDNARKFFESKGYDINEIDKFLETVGRSNHNKYLEFSKIENFLKSHGYDYNFETISTVVGYDYNNRAIRDFEIYEKNFKKLEDISSMEDLEKLYKEVFNTDSPKFEYRNTETIYNHLKDGKQNGQATTANDLLVDLFSKVNPNNESAMAFMRKIYSLSQDGNNLRILKSNDVTTSYYSPSNNHVMFREGEGRVLHTVSHEYGHALHYNVLNNEIPENFDDIMARARVISSRNGLLHQLSQKTSVANYKNYVEYIKTRNKSINDLAIEFEQAGYNRKTARDMAKLKFDDESLKNYYINNKSDNYSGAVSDMIDAVYGGTRMDLNDRKIQVICGHSYDYFFGNNFNQFAELIANFSSLKVLDGHEELEYVRRMFGDDFYQMLDDTYTKMIS